MSNSLYRKLSIAMFVLLFVLSGCENAGGSLQDQSAQSGIEPSGGIIPPVPLYECTMENVLFVSNLNSVQSMIIKNYYMNHRPGASRARYIDISAKTNEIISEAEFNFNVRKPVLDYILANPSYDIRYIVMSMGIASRTSGGGVSTSVRLFNGLSDTGFRSGATYGPGSMNVFDPAEYPGSTALVSFMNMGSLEATIAYIDKLEKTGNLMAVKSDILSSSGTEMSGNTYYMEEVNPNYTINLCYDMIRELLNCNPLASYVYNDRTHIFEADNVAGYCSWGANGMLGNDYSTSGAVRFSGKSEWYLLATMESGNGQMINLNQGDFINFFSRTAFGGLNYENTPAGMAGFVEEPYIYGLYDPMYFALWEAGYVLADTAWSCRRTPFYIVIGDPLIRK